MSETANSSRPHPAIAAAVGVIAFLGATLFATRGGVRLGFDSFYYVEYAKSFRQALPGSFGSAWPFGWPLLGSLVSHLGLSTYRALFALEVASIAVLAAIAAKGLDWERAGRVTPFLFLGAVSSTVGMVSSAAAAFSEVPFAVALLLLAATLVWDSRWSAVAAAGCMILAFGLRYAGALTPLIALAWVWHRRRSEPGVKVAPVVAALVASAVLMGGLLLWNREVTGHITGIPRGHPAAATWPAVWSDFGWSLPNLLGGFGLCRFLGFESAGRLVGGLVLTAAIILAGLRGCSRGRTALVRTCGAVVATYAVGLIGLRCVGQFDDLYNARMFVPLLVPLALVTADAVSPRILAAVGIGLLAANFILAGRGLSREIGGDISPALAVVADTCAPQCLAVNDAGLTLAARVSSPVIRAVGLDWTVPRPQVRYLVLAGRPRDRDGTPGDVAPEWRELAVRLLAGGRYRERLRLPNLIVLEQTPVPN